MKWLLVVLLASITTASLACPKGASEWNGGCVYDLQPQLAEPVKPSDEVPPSNKMPSYQRADVNLVDAPNCAKEDERMDQEKKDADAEGKRRAKLK